jgi:hypothetical protein
VSDITIKRSIDEWETILRADIGQAIEAIIAFGRHLAEAKDDLGYGGFAPLLHRLQLDDRKAQRFMAIAANRALTNPANARKLPASMRTLAELATISAPVLEGYIKDGVIHVTMERKDAEALKRAANPKRDGRSRQRPSTPANPVPLLDLPTGIPKPTPEAMEAKAKAEAERETERLAKAGASEPERKADIHTPTPLMAVHVLIAHLRRYGIRELPHADLLELFNTLDQAFEADKGKSKTEPKGKAAAAKRATDTASITKGKSKATKPLTTEAKAVLAEVERDLNVALFGSPKSEPRSKTGSKTRAKAKGRR